MRITSSMYYKNIYSDNNSKLSKNLFDVNKQISSGLKIQYAKDDVRTFTETMRLDNELATINQVSKSVDSGYKVSTQTDSVLNEFQTTMDRTKSLLIQASNSSQSESSMDAIAAELRGIEKHLTNLSNTSIGGKYLFSGSATSTKPIDENGIYKGNDKSLNAFAGNGISQQYNLTGADLFLGEENLTKKEVISNVPQYNLSSKYPLFSDPTNTKEALIITPSDSIRDLMGDIDDNSNSTNHFYLNGVKSDGTFFTSHITMDDSNKVDDLLTQIGNAYGNTASMDVVNVSMNKYGEIVVEDKLKGSSKLDFHLVGAVDYHANASVDAANIADGIYANPNLIDNLKYGETDFDKIITGTSDAPNQFLYIKKFVQSPFDEANVYSNVNYRNSDYNVDGGISSGDTLTIKIDDGNGNISSYSESTYEKLKEKVDADGYFTVDIDGNKLGFDLSAKGLESGASISEDLKKNGVTIVPVEVGGTIISDFESMLYDRVNFTKDGSKLTSNVAQVLNKDNSFATNTTKLSEVFSGVTYKADGSYKDGLDGKVLKLKGLDIGGNTYEADINLLDGGSTFTVGSNTYDIFNMADPRDKTPAGDMTYQQLMDVVNMVTTGKLPASEHSADDYDSAINDSNDLTHTYLSYDGKLSFEDKTASTTKATISLYDSNAGNFGNDASVANFQANNALTVRDAKTDFFKTLDEVIKSVENHKLYPDSENGDMRNVGIENAIAMIDDLQEHVGRSHSLVGAQSNALSNSLERSQTLEISTMTLRASIIDTDLAEASLSLTQFQLNYEAMLSTVGKVSKLSLVNYL